MRVGVLVREAVKVRVAVLPGGGDGEKVGVRVGVPVRDGVPVRVGVPVLGPGGRRRSRRQGEGRTRRERLRSLVRVGVEVTSGVARPAAARRIGDGTSAGRSVAGEECARRRRPIAGRGQRSRAGGRRGVGDRSGRRLALRVHRGGGCTGAASPRRRQSAAVGAGVPTLVPVAVGLLRRDGGVGRCCGRRDCRRCGRSRDRRGCRGRSRIHQARDRATKSGAVSSASPLTSAVEQSLVADKHGASERANICGVRRTIAAGVADHRSEPRPPRARDEAAIKKHSNCCNLGAWAARPGPAERPDDGWRVWVISPDPVNRTANVDGLK